MARRVGAIDRRHLVRAQVALAAAAAASAAHDPWAAEGPAREAQRLAAAVPAPPLAGRAIRLQGDLAVATRRLASAGPLYRRALDEQRRLGLVADAGATARALAAVEGAVGGRPPTSPSDVASDGR